MNVKFDGPKRSFERGNDYYEVLISDKSIGRIVGGPDRYADWVFDYTLQCNLKVEPMYFEYSLGAMNAVRKLTEATDGGS